MGISKDLLHLFIKLILSNPGWLYFHFFNIHPISNGSQLQTWESNLPGPNNFQLRPLLLRKFPGPMQSSTRIRGSVNTNNDSLKVSTRIFIRHFQLLFSILYLYAYIEVLSKKFSQPINY